MEKDDELKGEGNSYDFGARMYDPRIGRWFSIDSKYKKYADLSPYNFSNNNPILFKDFDGNDFGIIINHNTKQIMIISTVYTTNIKSYNQALIASQQWNSKSANIDGYNVVFFVQVIKPSKGSFSASQLASNSRVRFAAAAGDKIKDPTGNVYSGNEGPQSRSFTSTGSFVGGVTANGESISMNTDSSYGDMGTYSDLVAHEMGHLFGLDDQDGDGNGVTDPYYGGKNGIMEYRGTNLSSISDNDVRAVLKYAKDFLSSQTTGSDVKILTQEGNAASTTNPLGLNNRSNTIYNPIDETKLPSEF